MKIHDVSQRTPEWHALRSQCIITASEMGMWLTKNDATSRNAMMNHIASKLAEPIYRDASLLGYETLQKIISKEEKALDYNLPIQRGNELEAAAREEYARKIQAPVALAGFVTSELMPGCGLSPDGLIVAEGMPSPETGETLGTQDYPESYFSHGLEMKCPIPETHIKWNLAGGLPDEHRCQVHGSMAISGLNRWDFMSFCPGFKPLLVTVERDHFTEQIASGLRQLVGEYCIVRAKVRSMWAGGEGAA